MNNNNINNTTSFVNKIYDDLGYLDLYGNSVIIFVVITLFVFLVYSYCKIMQTKETISKDWIKERCKPQNILFAGFINKPHDKTAIQYTNENFQYCVQNTLMNISGYALEPIQYMIKLLTTIFQGFLESLNNIRSLMRNIRENFKIFAEDILNKLLNIIIPIQHIFISLTDTLKKIHGVMTTGLYTMLGSYNALQSLMGATLELIIKLLTVLSIVIVGLSASPAGAPTAAMATTIFLAIAIPLTTITYFMSEALHIKTSPIPKLRCFDEDTILTLNNGTKKTIKNINVGDFLEDNVKITAKIKVSAHGLIMYNLDGIIVSEKHKIFYNNKWINASKHPTAKKIHLYNKSYLYCLNTDSKRIILKNYIFSDWDELYEHNLVKILNITNKLAKNQSNDIKNIHKYLDKGFKEDTKILLLNKSKYIKDINIGEQLLCGNIVYGIVEIDSSDLINNNNDLINNNNCLVKNDLANSEAENNKLENNQLEKHNNNNKLYHLLTSNDYFFVNTTLINDYNYLIDKYIV